jgi:hypothetical protein
MTAKLVAIATKLKSSVVGDDGECIRDSTGRINHNYPASAALAYPHSRCPAAGFSGWNFQGRGRTGGRHAFG